VKCTKESSETQSDCGNAGEYAPFTCERAGLDPAIIGAPVMTTLEDITEVEDER